VASTPTHPVLDLQLRSPLTSIKRRTGEQLTVTVSVHSKAAADDILVELWSGVFHGVATQQAAIRMHHSRSAEGSHFFECRIPLVYTGYFPIAIRCRHKDQQFWQWFGGTPKHEAIKLWVEPAWVYDSVVYNAFVRYFGAEKLESNGTVRQITSGTFAHVREHLERLKEMGINVLYLNPVHMIGELYRNYNPHDLLPEYLQPGCPYSVKDYKSVDPELSFGDDSTKSEHPFNEFKKLIHAAHELGIRVIMDLVFNHSAHDAVFQRIHPEWFLYKENIWSLEEPYLYPDDIKQGKPWGDPKHTFSPYDHGWWWKDAAQLNWNNIHSYDERFSPKTASNNPPVNPTIDDMYEYFKGIVKFWIREFGIDGFRCDVAYRVPLDFWQACILEAQQTARTAHPENGSIDGTVVFIAEDYYMMNRQLLEAGFTACYGDYANKLRTLPEITGYLDYLFNISGQHFPDGTLWFIFPECHDFHRTPEKIAKELREHHRDADLNANKSRWTITACLPGMPMIFNGFEKIEWQPANLFSYSSIDWESDKDITEHIKAVNLIRRHERVLQRGSYHYLHTSEGITEQSKVFSFARILGKECFIIVVNLDIVHPVSGVTVFLPAELPIDYTKPYALDDRLHAKRYERSGAELQIVLEPGEAHIFKVKQ
jgi:glycosidase